MKRTASLLPLLFLLVTGTVGAHTPGEIDHLARSGAPQLALRLLQRAQPEATSDAPGWMAWERQRIEILQTNGEWEAIVEHTARLPEGLPAPFLAWVATQRAAALLELGRGGEARELLAGLLWGESASAEALPVWRQMVIRAYLISGEVDDAHTAMLRYQQDYGGGGEEWRRLRARVLIRAGRPRDALPLLDQDRSAEGRALMLLARLRGGEDPQAVRREADRLAAANEAKGVRPLLWLVSAEAAGRGEEAFSRMRGLERVLALRHLEGAVAELFDVGADALWRAYLDYGLELGNQEQLLIGQDQAWYAAAAKEAKKRPSRAKALLAVVALNAEGEGQAAVAHREFLRLQSVDEEGINLVRRLYLESARFPKLADVPPAVRYLLLDQALSGGDIPLASRLMGSLERPPAGEDGFAWATRRARVMILAGEVERGIAVLDELADRGKALKALEIDRLMQVLFDLQNLGRHREALALFAKLEGAELDARQRREILFWIGDSRKGLGDYEEAARLYLASATYDDPYALDQWAQSARYAAAEALSKAGLRKDAQGIYQQLIAATKDPERKAVLRQRMQELWLVDERGGGQTP